MKSKRLSINEKRRQARKNKKKAINTDCYDYAKDYNERSRFIASAVCGIEGPQTGTMLVADNVDLVNISGIREEYEEYIKLSDESTIYDKIFIKELRRNFDCGSINGLNSICGICSSEMKRRVKLINHRIEIFQKQHTNFKGLFTGSFPSELSNLTAVERVATSKDPRAERVAIKRKDSNL
jgi:hypothetical protein